MKKNIKLGMTQQGTIRSPAVSMPNSFMLSILTTVESGEDFTFTVTLSDGYKTASPVVFVNGQELSGVKNEDVFTYTVPGITAQPVISVSVVPKPQYTVTFEQIAAMMYRYAQCKGYDVSVGENTNILSYNDFGSISEYAIASMQYAVGSGSMKGKSDSTLNPLDNATRAEIAAILHRFVEANK